MRSKGLYWGIVTLAIGVGLVASLAVVRAGQAGDQAVAIDADDIGGVVTGPNGPEAGVWVIAETTNLPTRLIKTVVTDDDGRYVVPDLPDSEYDVWVRGYGLVDSQKVMTTPGNIVNLTAVVAPDKKAAAEYYPAQYWYSMLQLPPESDFPGTGPAGNGIAQNIHSQGAFVARVVNTDGCSGCHQMGNKATRTIPQSILDETEDSRGAWDRRLLSGQAGGGMSARFNQVGLDRTLGMFADWTDRIADGELPFAEPARPQGRERDVVVTVWDWAGEKVYLHDAISSDKRDPTVNANGPIYGALEASADYMSVIDPVTHTSSQIQLTPRDPNTPTSGDNPPAAPSPYWGEEVIWDSQTSAHSFAMDGQGRVWSASIVRGPDTPAWCRAGSDHPSAKLFPIDRSSRGLIMYDPATEQTHTIDTCFSYGHVNLDENDLLWSSFGPTGVEGWFDINVWDETGDEQLAQGWTPFVLDHNGNGKRDAYTEPDAPDDPTMDKRVAVQFYGDSPAYDGSIWGTLRGMPGALGRLVPGDNPSETALVEIYEVPWENPNATEEGYGPRGLDVDSDNVVWTVLSSGHLSSFDRRKCTGELNGPTATGQHCAEGWTLYPLPGPGYKGATQSASAESAYYNFTDRFDMLGVGTDISLVTGNLSEALLALVDDEFLTLRVPYPMGYFAKGIDGRIDDPGAGWKGKGVYTPVSTRAPFHMETGKGTLPKLVKFQMRPNPLAK